MKRRSLLLGVLGLAAVLTMSAGGFAATSAALAPLKGGSDFRVNSVSCAAAGTCAGGGFYRDGSGGYQAFVVDETNGSWGKAIEVPGSATLNKYGDAGVDSVSCATAGNCTATGYYLDGFDNYQAFVVDETNGTWGDAIEVPGSATLNKGGYAGVYSVSCPTAGNCSGAGYYLDHSENLQAFVVDETSGTWGTAAEVPGSESLNSGGNAWINSVSCATPGNCAAAGHYEDGSIQRQAFVVDETNGIWGTAIEVPGSAALNLGFAEVDSVSCPTAGNCSAAGYYFDHSEHFQAFVADETNGTWGNATEVPGSESLNTGGGDAWASSISCATAGNCAAGGSYRDTYGDIHVFVVDENNGSWGTAVEIPGSATLNKGGQAGVNSVSCATAGNCAAGGYYRSSGRYQALVADETNGIWGTAIEVPGTASLNSGGDARVGSISCATAGNCAAGGGYRDGSGHQALLADEANGTWGKALEVGSTFACVVPKLIGKTLHAAKKELASAFCRLGKVKKTVAKAKAGRVVAQHPKPDTRLKNGAKVALTVSKGKS